MGGNGILVDYNVARFFADTEAIYSCIVATTGDKMRKAG
jgi:hypothetical protein